MNNELQVIVDQSGLEKTKAQVLLDNFSNYFQIASEWEKRALTIKVTDDSHVAEMKMARVGRLELREKRILLEKTRKSLKEQSIREGKAIDGIANALKAVIIPIEQYLETQEKFIEIKEKEKLEQERIEKEKKEEAARLEEERLCALERERRSIAVEYRQFWTTEEYVFKTMSQINFESIMKDLKRSKTEYEEAQEKIKKDNKRLQEEAKEMERKAKAKKDAHEKVLAEERAKAEAERKRQEEVLRKERETAKKKQLAAEAKQAQIRKEVEAKAEAERKEKERLEEELRNQIECPFCKKKFTRR